MDGTLTSALFYLIVPLIGAIVAYLWGWKGSLIFVALGVAGLVAFWAVASVFVYPEARVEHRLSNAAVFAMLVAPASLAWSALAGIGGALGLFVRLFIARKPA